MVNDCFKALLHTFILAIVSCQCGNAQQQPNETTYSGNSPCGNYVRSVLNIPGSADCDRVKWLLTFIRDGDIGTPTSFKLEFTFGMQQQSGPGFSEGGTSRKIEGKCKMIKGTPGNHAAIIYELDAGQKSLQFIQIDEAILHLLYRDKNLMIGDAGWSYTLNKIKK